ncbi:hypothetical protein [Flavobacterium sp. FlaQc-48]|uniref:hypothetical protein n=1 Tax=Flavobacterium sp. FlaQc-48 TaxID=3374181 RepID=UPI0037572F65
MKTDVQKAVEVDAYILKASGLIKEKRGYNALLNLLQSGTLMNERLGMPDTMELCKILIHLKFDYEFIANGVKLTENAKVNYYNTVMYPPKAEASPERIYQNKHDRRLSVGKEERGTRHWGNQIMAAKKDSE